MSPDERELLINEYARLEDLPTISLISGNKYIPDSKFTNQEIDEAALKILGNTFYDLSPNEQEFLIDEYSRLEELPTISLVSDESIYELLEQDPNTMEYYYRDEESD